MTESKTMKVPQKGINSTDIIIYKGIDDNGKPYELNQFAILHFGALPTLSTWNTTKKRSGTFTGRPKTISKNTLVKKMQKHAKYK